MKQRWECQNVRRSVESDEALLGLTVAVAVLFLAVLQERQAARHGPSRHEAFRAHPFLMGGSFGTLCWDA